MLKGHTYTIFKPIFGYEKYLDIIILPTKFRKILVNFRTSNHRLPIETGRWFGIPLDDRCCTFCNTRQLADEMHFIFDRYKDTKFCYRLNIFKFCELLSSLKLKTLKRLCIFILNIYLVLLDCTHLMYLCLIIYVCVYIYIVLLTIYVIANSCIVPHAPTSRWFELINETETETEVL